MSRRRLARQRGFTMVEVLIAMTIMAIGLLGVLALQRSATSASGYSRRATEAAILAEDKLEQLRTQSIEFLTSDSDQVDAQGLPATGPFTRTWTAEWVSDLVTITVTVAWEEVDGAHAITFRTQRLR